MSSQYRDTPIMCEMERVMLERLRLHAEARLGREVYGPEGTCPTRWLDTVGLKIIPHLGSIILRMEAEIARFRCGTVKFPLEKVSVAHEISATIPATWWDHLKTRLPRCIRQFVRVRTATYVLPVDIPIGGEISVDVWANLPSVTLPPRELGPCFYVATMSNVNTWKT